MKAKWKNNPYICGGIAVFIVAALLMMFYRIISDFEGVAAALSTVADVLLPFIVGLVLAYLLSPIYDAVKKWSYRLFVGKKKTPPRFANTGARIVASVASVLFLLAIVGGLLSLVIPQAYLSISGLITSLPQKSDAVLAWIDTVELPFGAHNSLSQWLSYIVEWLTVTITDWVENDLIPNIGSIAKDVSSGVFSVVSTVINVIIGVIICVYTLNSKEIFAAQAKKITYSVFKTSTANYVINIVRYVDNTFGRYINGMLIDALMVGVVCFILMSIFRMPYALLISAIVGLFNIVPIFGPIVAAVIGTFFVLLEDPLKALVFVIMVLVLQQVDGNIIAPKILGDQTGLSSFWVVFAILVGGGLFGLVGMIFGVPLFAVVYMLVQQLVAYLARKRKVPEDTAAYQELWEIDEVSGEPIYREPTDVLENQTTESE